MREARADQPQISKLSTRIVSMEVIQSILIPLFLWSGALLLWVISLPRINPKLMSDFGLVSVLPFSYFAAVGLLTLSYIIIVNQTGRHDFILVLHILLLIFILHGTPQIVYGTIRYSWAWKHVGIVDFIQRNGTVDPTITNLNAYHNWPGFFALMAMYNVLAGLPSSISYAGWGPVFFNLLDLGVLLVIYRSLTRDTRLIWLGIWLYYFFSWIGQDYFSPQALSYFLYLVAIAMILRWFRQHQVTEQTTASSRNILQRLGGIYHKIVNHAILENLPPDIPNASQRIFIMGILILIFAAVASSHQLTPLMLVSALVVLVVFQITNQRFLPILMAIITAVWVVFMAVGFLQGNLYWIVQSIGSLLDNVNGNLVNLAKVSAGQQLIARIDRLMSAAVWGLGMLGLYRRVRRGRWEVPVVLLALAPFPMLAINSYGGEMLFRVYMFGLPFMAFLAASLFYPSESAGRTWKTPLFTLAISLMLIPGFLFSYYGKDRMYYFSPDEIAATQYLYTNAPKGALIFDGIWDWPRQYTHYENYNYVSLLLLPASQRDSILQNPVSLLPGYMYKAAPGSVYTDLISSGNVPGSVQGGKAVSVYPAAFFVITRTQIAEAEMTGTLPVDWSVIIIHALSQSNQFKIVFDNPDAIIFQYVSPTGSK